MSLCLQLKLTQNIIDKFTDSHTTLKVNGVVQDMILNTVIPDNADLTFLADDGYIFYDKSIKIKYEDNYNYLNVGPRHGGPTGGPSRRRAAPRSRCPPGSRPG